jgi:hypothetical protein
MCGVLGGKNDTCNFLEDKYEDDGKGTKNFTCRHCTSKVCNAAHHTSNANIIALIISAIVTAIMKLH